MWSSHVHCKFGEQTEHSSLAIFTLWAARKNLYTKKILFLGEAGTERERVQYYAVLAGTAI